MVARLPTPGGDNGNWGTLLNSYLSVVHNSDGTLKSLGSALIAASDAPDNIKAVATYVCDGTADESEINTALGAYKHVVLSEGTFTIASPILVQNHGTTIEGAGPSELTGATQVGGGTLILAQTGASALNNSYMMLVQTATNNLPVYGVTLKNFTLDGHNFNTTMGGIYYRSNRGNMLSVNVARCTSDGIHFRGYTSGEGFGGNAWGLYDSAFWHVQSYQNQGRGFFCETKAEDMHFTNCLAFSNLSHGWEISASSQQLTGCHAYSNGNVPGNNTATAGNGILVDGASARTKISNCKIEGNAGGIYVSGTASEVLIVGNGFKDNYDLNSAATTNTYDDINLAIGTNHSVIGNAIVRTDNSGNTRYGINIASGVTGIASGNSIQGTFGTAAIVNGASQATFHTFNNRGYNFVPFASNAVSTAIASTNVETDFSIQPTISTGFFVANRIFKVIARGVYSTDAAAPTMTLKLKLHNGTSPVTLASTGAFTLIASQTNRGWEVQSSFWIVGIGSNGTIDTQGFARFISGTLPASATTDVDMSTSAGVSGFNTTLDQTLRLSVTWGTSSANNTIKLRQLLIEPVG